MYKDPLVPGYMYHIYNRGNNKERIFREEKNYPYFLQQWKKHILPVAETFTYSLLPNHFHFLVAIRETADPFRIRNYFSNFFNAYAKSFNKAYERTGSLFQERFGRKLIDNNDYFTQIVFYIHSNPQKHGLVSDFTTYAHSSYQSILSQKPTLLERHKVLDWFGGVKPFESFHKGNQEILIEYLKMLRNQNL